MKQPTPYYIEDGVALYHGKAEDILPTLKPADLVLTDVPYGAVNRKSGGLRNLDKSDADQTDMTPETLARLLIPSSKGSIYIWCGTEQVSCLRAAMVAEGMSTRAVVWEKTNPSPMNGQHLWLSSIELCVYGKRAGAEFNEVCASPVWRGPVAESNGHPTPKPQWLMNKLIQASSSKGQTVLDPFCGSGTTLRAAKDLGRKVVGIEANERYCKIAVARLSQEVLGL